MPIEEKCKQCLDEDARKRFYTPECGTINDWLDRIRTETTKDGLIATWTVLMTTKWNRQEQQQLGFAYVKHLTNIISQEYWDKKIEKKTIFSALKALS